MSGLRGEHVVFLHVGRRSKISPGSKMTVRDQASLYETAMGTEASHRQMSARMTELSKKGRIK